MCFCEKILTTNSCQVSIDQPAGGGKGVGMHMTPKLGRHRCMHCCHFQVDRGEYTSLGINFVSSVKPLINLFGLNENNGILITIYTLCLRLAVPPLEQDALCREEE